MSDTPRTDAEAFLPHDSKYRVCDVDFARQLERELNAANERIKRLEEVGDEMCSEFKAFCPLGSKTRDKWRKAKEAKP
jgi:hypothetical protein